MRFNFLRREDNDGMFSFMYQLIVYDDKLHIDTKISH